jgi:hypothetical protein
MRPPLIRPLDELGASPRSRRRRGGATSTHRWPRLLAVGAVSACSLVLAMSALAYRSFVTLPT